MVDKLPSKEAIWRNPRTPALIELRQAVDELVVQSQQIPACDSPELTFVIIKAVEDGGRAARDQVEAIARATGEMALIFLCHGAFTRWGADGLQLIVDIAVTHRTVKSKAAALTILASLARHGALPPGGHYALPLPLDPKDLQLDSLAIRAPAKQALRLLLLSLPDDELLLPLHQSIIHLQRTDADTDTGAQSELVRALSARWLQIGPAVLNQYEQLLLEAPSDEPAFQRFFCDYPQLLDPMAVHVWSRPDFHGVLEPDFVVRRADDSYLVIEIECPGKSLITRDNRLSRDAGHAEAQALEYEEFLSARVAEARTHFPHYRRADCLTVIGLERGLAPAQRDALDRANGRRQNARVVGFDWLLDRARTVVSNVREGDITVIDRHRVV